MILVRGLVVRVVVASRVVHVGAVMTFVVVILVARVVLSWAASCSAN